MKANMRKVSTPDDPARRLHCFRPIAPFTLSRGSIMTRRTSLALAVAAGLGLLPAAAGQDKKDGKGLKFEIYEDGKKEFRWRLKAANGQVIASSGQGYKDKRDCKKGVEVIMTGAASATVEEVTEKK
jgi:uncharacterized protein YegP (UPF0339 family)